MGGALYHKVKGGTGAIIQALADQLDEKQVLLNKKVTSIHPKKDSVAVYTQYGDAIEADCVIVAIPPKVAAHQMLLPLEPEVEQIMKHTHTWMGESSKFTVFTDQDYWKCQNLSGFVFSNYDLIREMQDHSTKDTFGFTGFLQPTTGQMHSSEDRRRQAIREIESLMDIPEAHILGYEDFLWGTHFSDEVNGNYNAHLMPHQNNGHNIYQQAHCNGRVVFAGAETSAINPGYMEGAVISAYRAISLVNKGFNQA
jgi:monoamine oxidase